MPHSIQLDGRDVIYIAQVDGNVYISPSQSNQPYSGPANLSISKAPQRIGGGESTSLEQAQMDTSVDAMTVLLDRKYLDARTSMVTSLMKEYLIGAQMMIQEGENAIRDRMFDANVSNMVALANQLAPVSAVTMTPAYNDLVITVSGDDPVGGTVAFREANINELARLRNAQLLQDISISGNKISMRLLPEGLNSIQKMVDSANASPQLERWAYGVTMAPATVSQTDKNSLNARMLAVNNQASEFIRAQMPPSGAVELVEPLGSPIGTLPGVPPRYYPGSLPPPPMVKGGAGGLVNAPLPRPTMVRGGAGGLVNPPLPPPPMVRGGAGGLVNALYLENPGNSENVGGNCPVPTPMLCPDNEKSSIVGYFNDACRTPIYACPGDNMPPLPPKPENCPMVLPPYCGEGSIGTITGYSDDGCHTPKFACSFKPLPPKPENCPMVLPPYCGEGSIGTITGYSDDGCHTPKFACSFKPLPPKPENYMNGDTIIRHAL